MCYTNACIIILYMHWYNIGNTHILKQTTVTNKALNKDY